MSRETVPPGGHPAPADFVRPGDYTTPFFADALAAFPKAPLVTTKALWWYLTRKRVRARNYLHEVVGRRLVFAMRLHLRPVSPPEPVPPLRCTVVEPALALDKAQALDHDVILVLRPGDALLPGAEQAIAAAFADERVVAAFADEVLAMDDLVLPLPKPDFDEDLLSQVDYVGPFLAIRREALLAMGTFTDARDLLLRIARERGADAIGHILGPVVGRDLRGESPPTPSVPPGILHPKRRADRSPSPTRHAEERPEAASRSTHDFGASFETAASRPPQDEAVEDGEPASKEREDSESSFAPLPNPPLVSVIVPTRDRIDLLGPCLDGLLHATEYPRLEVIVADNGSTDAETLERLAAYARDPRVRVVRMPGPFNFSRLNNDAAALARGEILLFLNNDIEVMEPTWLGALVVEAVRPEVGAVGATLLYPNGLVQHAGVVIGLAGGPAGHAFHLFPADHPGFLHMLQATRRVSAVTAACLAVRRETFLAAGGFDADAFPVALNDVDLCLRLDAAGLRNLNVGRARLLHKESASRPSDRHPEEEARYARELAAFTARWPHRLARDPWYNPHHGWAAADFSVPRWTGAWPGSGSC